MKSLQKTSVFLVLASLLTVAPRVYGQEATSNASNQTDESGRERVERAGPTINLATNPRVDVVFTPITPCRVCDTRGVPPGFPQDPAGCPLKGAINPGASRDIVIAGLCGVPANASAVSVNITAVPTGVGVGDFRIAPNPPGIFPNTSIVNFQNGDNAANAADVPIGTGVRIFDDSQAANVIVDVMGYYRDVGCQAGTVKALGLCFETALRPAANVFTASDTCRDQGLPGGGRLGTGLELRSLRGGGPLTLSATGEWTESVYVNGTTFSAMTISDSGGFDDQSTISLHQYRCVFNPLP